MSTLPALNLPRRQVDRRRGLFLLFLLMGFWGPGPALAQRLSVPSPIRPGPTGSGKHCLGEPIKKMTLEHTVAGSINPLGIGNILRLGWCTPLIRKPGLLFDFTNFDIGVLFTNSPTDVQLGVQMFVSPLSILVLRAEATAFYIWPIPLQGAGFITVNSPSEFTLARLSPDPTGRDPNDPTMLQTPAATAFGARAMIGATLQGQVPLSKKLDIAAAIGANLEYWSLSSSALAGLPAGGGFYAARRDVILLGSADWVLLSTAALLLNIKIHGNSTLKIGAVNDLAYVPSHGYLGNIAGGLLVWSVQNLRSLAKNFNFFARVGTFTHHAFRVGGGATIALGLSIVYELRPSPGKLPPAASGIDGEARPSPAPTPPPTGGEIQPVLAPDPGAAAVAPATPVVAPGLAPLAPTPAADPAGK